MLLALEIERNRPPSAQQRIVRHPDHPRPLDADHLGPMIGQHHRRERPRPEPRHLDDRQSVERSRHAPCLALHCQAARPRYALPMIDAQDRSLFSDDHHAFRDTVRKVLTDVIAPRMDAHEAEGTVEREAWARVGARRPALPAGARSLWRAGPRFRLQRHRRRGVEPTSDRPRRLHPAVGHRRRLSRPLRQRGAEAALTSPAWSTATTISAIAMTEPGAGSDLQGIETIARRDGNGWRLSRLEDLHHQRPERRSGHRRRARPTEDGGARACRCSWSRQSDEGFTRGRNLDKIGLHGNDTSELFFDEVRVPIDQSARRGERRLRLC